MGSRTMVLNQGLASAKVHGDSTILKLPDPNILKLSTSAHTEAGDDDGCKLFTVGRDYYRRIQEQTD